MTGGRLAGAIATGSSCEASRTSTQARLDHSRTRHPAVTGVPGPIPSGRCCGRTGRSITSRAPRSPGVVHRLAAPQEAPGTTRRPTACPHPIVSGTGRRPIVPTLSTQVHRHSQVVIPSSGQPSSRYPTDVDRAWGNRCGQTLSVTGVPTACGRVWISC